MATNEEVILKELDKEMDLFVDRVFQLSQERLIDDGKTDTSNLLRSGNIIRRKLEKEIIYSAPYADVIEFGRHPGTMPPSDQLVKWVQRKLHVRDIKEAKRVAFAIALSIKKRGMDPSPYLQPAINQTNIEFQKRKVRVA